MNKNNIPNDYYKYANIRPRKVFDKDKKETPKKWRQRRFSCANCKKEIKNVCKYYYNKNCNK